MVQIQPLGGRCALASAVVGPHGTATACPDARSWMLNEAAVSQTYFNGYVSPATFHNRGGAFNCWDRAATAGIVA